MICTPISADAHAFRQQSFFSPAKRASTFLGARNDAFIPPDECCTDCSDNWVRCRGLDLALKALPTRRFDLAKSTLIRHCNHRADALKSTHLPGLSFEQIKGAPAAAAGGCSAKSKARLCAVRTRSNQHLSRCPGIKSLAVAAVNTTTP